ncbi:hypothetical protein MMC18_009260 [Xylographa bjoerkii]|nr:hypothetical protein [Xylographa bjoerkii]
MESLRDEMGALRVRNPESRYFVPYQQYHDFMTKDRIRQGLIDSNITTYHLLEITKCIVEGARQIFGILILLRRTSYITKFIESDQFQGQLPNIDHKLPFRRELLEKILPGALAAEFYEKQWEFTSPVFSRRMIPRSLDDDSILPTLTDEIVGEGGFGTVHEVTLHPCHQDFGIEKCARKEFLPESTNTEDFKIELRNLSILNHLKHANIIELLSAYSYRGMHNLIFPLARSGDLSALLRAPQRPSEFHSNLDFIISLSNLASAIDKVHNFSAQKLDLNMIGCHHDLKPRNILVDGSRFILADFGLSRLKGTSKSSKTLFRIGQGDYLAPECEDFENDIQKRTISRSSDIWSFGCILAEVLTYMLAGAPGVSEFREMRKYPVLEYRFYHFHSGREKLNMGVQTWLSRLSKNCPKMEMRLLRLVRGMLTVDPDKRPTSAEVTARLRFIAIDELSQPITRLFHRVCEQSGSIEAVIEETRFESWKWICGITSVEENQPLPAGEFELEFHATLDLLSEVRRELEMIASMTQFTNNRVLFPLRHLNNGLRDLLPWGSRQRLQTHLEYSIVKSQNPDVLEETQHAIENWSSKNRMAMLAAIKRMTILAMEQADLHESPLSMSPKTLQYLGSTAEPEWNPGVLIGNSRDETRQVLVEWMRYDSPLVDEQIGRERLVRVEAMAELLNIAEKPEDFRTLRCSGFFHDPDECRFGLVFDYPDPSPLQARGVSVRLVTLKQVFDTPGLRRQLPTLGDRFKLAISLAVSVAEFHKVGWLHKNISSTNVVFFPPECTPFADHAAHPYIIGFNHSRPDEPFSFTEGPAAGSDYRQYQHPEYLRNKLRYCPEFDYYSLGVVLLEIGLWNTLHAMTDKEQKSLEDFRNGLLETRVPILKQIMGVRYFQVVDVCLRTSFGVPLSQDSVVDRTAVHLSFERQVVEQLSLCSV